MTTREPPAMSGPIASLVEWAKATPAAAALLCNGSVLSYADLLRGVRLRAAWLHEIGVRAGDTVAYLLESDPHRCIAQVELFYAIAYLGSTILPLYPGGPEAGRRQSIGRFHAGWVISGRPLEWAGTAIRIDPGQYEAKSGRWSRRAAPRGDGPARPFLYEFTSGTTGVPKVMLFTGRQYADRILVTARQFGWRADDVMVLPLRWPGKVGIKGLVRAHVLGAAYANEPFPETRLDLGRLIKDIGVTCVGGSPWQLRRLMASDHAAGSWPTALRVLGTAGAHIAPDEIRAVRETLATNFHVGYGTTEIGLMAHLGPEDAVDAAMRVVPGMVAESIDLQGQPLPVGRPGRLRFRAPWAATGYADNAEATAESFRDGWFLSSDWGSVSVDGRLVLGGRIDEVVNFGGAKLVPFEVERELLAHPAVADAALVGVPDAMAGELPLAFVVLRRSISVEDLRVFLASRLDQWQIPAGFVAVREIPRNPEGKILREHLQEIYLALRRKSNPGR